MVVGHIFLFFFLMLLGWCRVNTAANATRPAGCRRIISIANRTCSRRVDVLFVRHDRRNVPNVVIHSATSAIGLYRTTDGPTESAAVRFESKSRESHTVSTARVRGYSSRNDVCPLKSGEGGSGAFPRKTPMLQNHADGSTSHRAPHQSVCRLRLETRVKSTKGFPLLLAVRYKHNEFKIRANFFNIINWNCIG